MAAQVLSAGGASVTLQEAMPSLGRKLLMAGRGGLNLTHSESSDSLIARYGDSSEILRPMLEAFPPEALRAWARDLGQETIVGSSGRVFPATMKASPLLRAWLGRLQTQGVQIETRSSWRIHHPPAGRKQYQSWRTASDRLLRCPTQRRHRRPREAGARM